MKSIVVYKTLLVIGTLILAGSLAAQKPAIDLISSHQQYRHPEALIDTGYAANHQVREAVISRIPENSGHKQLKDESRKRRHRQIGPSLDSIFQTGKPEDSERKNSPVKISLINRRYNPLKILIFVIVKK